MSVKLKIIVGSTRPGRAGPTIGAWVAEAVAAHGGFDAEVVDLADVALPFLDEPNHPAMKKYEHEHTKRWSAIVDEAEAFIFVSPEYDFFPPATIVNAIQCLSQEWQKKPAAIVSYGGLSGGMRASEVLRSLISNVGMAPLAKQVPIPFYWTMVEDGKLKPTDPVLEGATGMLNELTAWSGALKTMRG